MSDITLTRIDDRLIHGQVMTAWVKKTHASRIVVIDDGVAKDDFMSEVLKMAAPSGITVDVYTISDALPALKGLLDDGRNDKIIILVKNPETIEAVIEGGIPIDKLIIGGMGAKDGRSVFYRNISMSGDEKASIKRMSDKGVRVTIHIIPDQKEVDVKKYL